MAAAMVAGGTGGWGEKPSRAACLNTRTRWVGVGLPLANTWWGANPVHVGPILVFIMGAVDTVNGEKGLIPPLPFMCMIGGGAQNTKGNNCTVYFVLYTEVPTFPVPGLVRAGMACDRSVVEEATLKGQSRPSPVLET